MPRIRHRFVKYGCHFQPVDSIRSPDARHSTTGTELPDEHLAANELAVDVGGECWGYHSEARVIDHHFARPTGNFPSASAGVLHLASHIHEYFTSHNFDTIWMVSHTSPDFDALCAAYLAGWIAQTDRLSAPRFDFSPASIVPGAWIDPSPKRRKIDWLAPYTSHLTPEQRWMILLASVACHADSCRRLPVARRYALPSILYAAQVRGRTYTTTEGASGFFDRARLAIHHRALNPLYDSIFESDPEYAPELALLAGSDDAYRRDLDRAARTVVTLPQVASWDRFFGEMSKRPLFPSAGSSKADPVQLDAPAGTPTLQFDGIFLRDPECILFKDFARDDFENSPSGRGFIFTAVAYSHRKQGINGSEYYFALHPERAHGCHLYHVWARLQAEEVKARHALAPPAAHPSGASPSAAAPAEARPGFEGRAGAWPAGFADPWFDGNNFAGTIVVTSNQGTAIAPDGAASDLSGDPVAELVRNLTTTAVYTSKLTLLDLPAASGVSKTLTGFDLADPNIKLDKLDVPDHRTFRFGFVEIREDAALLEGGLAQHIGRTLWPFLNPERPHGVPSDFAARHVFADQSVAGVWSRRGILMACKPAAAGRRDDLQKRFAAMCELATNIHTLLEETSASNGNRHFQPDLTDLNAHFTKIARLRWELSQPESRVLHHFFDAIGLEQSVHSLRDLAHSATARIESRERGFIEALLLAIYATEMAHAFSTLFHQNWQVAAGYMAGATLLVGGVAVLRNTFKPFAGRWLIAACLLLVLAAGLALTWLNQPGEPQHFPAPDETVTPNSPG